MNDKKEKSATDLQKTIDEQVTLIAEKQNSIVGYLAEIESLKKDLKEAVDGATHYSGKCESLLDENKAYGSRFLELEEKIEKLSAIEKEMNFIDDEVEIVAVPHNKNVPAPKIASARKSYQDNDGFMHYLVGKDIAKMLCSDIGSPMKFVLVGPVNVLHTTRMKGLFSEDVAIRRHEKKTLAGKAVWTEV